MSHRHILLVEFESELPTDAIEYVTRAVLTELGLYPHGDPNTTVDRTSVKVIDTQAFTDTYSVSSILRSTRNE